MDPEEKHESQRNLSPEQSAAYLDTFLSEHYMNEPMGDCPTVEDMLYVGGELCLFTDAMTPERALDCIGRIKGVVWREEAFKHIVHESDEEDLVRYSAKELIAAFERLAQAVIAGPDAMLAYSQDLSNPPSLRSRTSSALEPKRRVTLP